MRPKIWLGTMLLTLVPLMAFAQNLHEALVQELYDKSGIGKQIQELPRSIQASLDQPLLAGDRLQEPPPKVISLMKALAPMAFAHEGLKAVVIPELAAKLTTPDLKTVLKWLNSPLGIKCTQAEEEASTPEAYAEAHKYAASLKKSPPTPERLQVLQKLDAAVQGTKGSVDMVINLQVALLLGVNASLPKEQQQPLDHISRKIEKFRPEIEAVTKLEARVFLLYAYRSLTEEEIRQYIKFASSAVGTKYYAVANAALKKAVVEGGIKWGKAIGEAMKQVNSQAEV